MKQNKKAILALILAIISVMTLLSGCKKEPNKPVPADITDAPNTDDGKDRVVVLAQPSDPSNLDPHKANADIGGNVWENIAEELFRFNADYGIDPVLGESWEQLGENEWLIHLKKGIKFSNGEPFDAEAVIWNYERANSKEFPRQAFEFRDYYDHAEAVDPYTVKIITTTYDENFPAHFGCQPPMIAPQYSEQIGEDAISRNVIGTGPYTLESWDKDQQIVLKARDDYWGGAPDVKTYIIKTVPEAATRIAELLAGEVDIIYDVNAEDLPMLRGRENINIESVKLRRVFYLDFNTCDWSPAPELKDKRVRQAINYAVDRQAIIDNILGGYGYPLPTIWREDFRDYILKDRGFEYNPEKAKALLKDAGYENGFTLKCQVSNGLHPKAIEVTQAVASYLKDVNITMEVLPLELNTMRNVIINGQDSKKAEGMFFWSWASKPYIYDAWLTGIVHSSGMSSYNHIPGYDEICDNILKERDDARKADLLKEFQNMLVDDPPFLYLFQQVTIYATSDKIDWIPSKFNGILARQIKIP